MRTRFGLSAAAVVAALALACDDGTTPLESPRPSFDLQSGSSDIELTWACIYRFGVLSARDTPVTLTYRIGEKESGQLAVPARPGPGATAERWFSVRQFGTVRLYEGAALLAERRDVGSDCRPPRFLPEVLLPATVGSPYQVAFFRIRPGTPPTTWTLASGPLPAGLTFDVATGVLGGTPTQGGTFPIAIEIIDAANVHTRRNFSLVVNGGPPAITTLLLNAIRLTPSSPVLQGSGGTLPYTWSLPPSPAPPPWLSLTSAGVLTINAPTAGTFFVTLQLRDAANVTVQRQIPIIVAPKVAIASGAPPNWTVGAPYHFPVTANGAPTPFTFVRSAGTLPPGVTLSTAGLLSGTPTAAGTFTFSVRVTGADGTQDVKSYTVTIQLPPQMVFGALPFTTAGTNYNFLLVAQRGQPPYTWTLVTGPPGLTLVVNALGSRLSGQMAAGVHPVTLRVTDVTGAFEQRNFTLTVN